MAEASSKRIEDYAFIGNMMTGALVAKDGSIDWLCLPTFDSDACFSALLGTPDDGCWRIAPTGRVQRVQRAYRARTNILETRLETEDGVVTLIDFMPLAKDGRHVELIRVLRGDHGAVRIRSDWTIRFGYGANTPWIRRQDYGFAAISGPDQVEVHTPAHVTREGTRLQAEFTLQAGDAIPFRLLYHPSSESGNTLSGWREELDRLERWWRDWSDQAASHLDAHPRWQEAVSRSLITLKSMSFAPTGALVAAPTTSLPEQLGGPRNWDYRFCWIRDAALTLFALITSGYHAEARAWRSWLLRAAAGSPDEMQIMYGIDGRRRLTEQELPWLAGYENSRPVRIGNAAHQQLQLDVYGELIEALYVARKFDLDTNYESWRFQRVLLDHLAQIWQAPDQGIWEVRGQARNFTHSKMMAWVAFDRALRSADSFGLDGPVDQWRAVRDRIHADICQNGFDRGRNSFVQYYGGSRVDAALLQIPQVGFLPHDDPRVLGTIKAVEHDLLHDGFVRRYVADPKLDGLPGQEGAFLPCSFWLADAYALAGRRDDAEALFERLLSLRNDVGLLSEEYDPSAKRLVGNFPQAFSHIALVNTASNLALDEGPVHQRAHGTKSGKAPAGSAQEART